MVNRKDRVKTSMDEAFKTVGVILHPKEEERPKSKGPSP